MRSVPAQPGLSSVLVKPAGADCNLNCDYCFYRPKAQLYPDTRRPRMTEAVLDALIRQYMALAGPNPTFGWQGGEPALLGLDFYREAIGLQKRYGRSGQVVGNGFQTNGTFIDDDWATFLAAYKFLVGLSLDGPQELHDRHRLTLGEAPTWERVMQGVQILRRHAVEFNILCMITPESVTQADRLYRFFRDQGLRYLQFIPLVEPGEAPLTAASYSITPEQYGEFLCRMFDQWSREWPPECYIREFDDLLTVYAGHPMPSCVHQEQCGSYVVVEHNGDVYACDFMVTSEWRLGNLVETPLAELIASPKFGTFARRKSLHEAQCLECPWLPLCHGGCQKHRLILSSSVASPSYFCEAYKRLFRHSRRRLRRMAEALTGRRPAATERAPSRSAGHRAASARSGPGRNDLCPCGSGRKYKHCCLGRV